MKLNKRYKWMREWGLWASIALGIAPLATGCSGLVDPASQTKAPEQDVRNYYINLAQPKMEYQYGLTSKNAFLPASDVLVMDMRGLDTVSGSMPVYACDWSYHTAGLGTKWYYGLEASRAVALGIEMNNQFTDSWVELQSPIAMNSTWTFTSKNELITAKVVHYGSSATVGGKTYEDVVVVSYTGAAGTTGTTWFARGIGTIYTHIERPGSVLVDEQFQSMTQK